MSTENELLERIDELIRKLEYFATAYPAAPQLLYTRIQAANLLGISLSTLKLLISRGDVRVRRWGSAVLISNEELVRVSKKDFDTLWPEKGPKRTRQNGEQPAGDAWYESKT